MSGNPLNELRILVVEDNFLIASEIERVLDDAGAVVIGPVRNLDKALEVARSATLDGAVLDIDLSGERSFGAAYALARRDVPFIFVTGYRRDWLPDELRQVPLLGKPFERFELIEAAVQCMVKRRDGCGIGANRHWVGDLP